MFRKKQNVFFSLKIYITKLGLDLNQKRKIKFLRHVTTCIVQVIKLACGLYAHDCKSRAFTLYVIIAEH